GVSRLVTCVLLSPPMLSLMPRVFRPPATSISSTRCMLKCRISSLQGTSWSNISLATLAIPCLPHGTELLKSSCVISPLTVAIV
ncbi:hypothetical protein KI387_022684, partial [Taxus chinensis]